MGASRSPWPRLAGHPQPCPRCRAPEGHGDNAGAPWQRNARLSGGGANTEALGTAACGGSGLGRYWACMCPPAWCRCTFIPCECMPPTLERKDSLGLDGSTGVGVEDKTSWLAALEREVALLWEKYVALRADLDSYAKESIPSPIEREGGGQEEETHVFHGHIRRARGAASPSRVGHAGRLRRGIPCRGSDIARGAAGYTPSRPRQVWGWVSRGAGHGGVAIVALTGRRSMA